MLRVRFYANEDDYRPVKWPVKYPYWCSGYGEGYSVVVSFADNIEYIKENWPEATDIAATKVDAVTFSDRFPKPSWYQEALSEH